MTRIMTACLSLTCVSAYAIAGEPDNKTVKAPEKKVKPAAPTKPGILLRYRFRPNQVVAYRVEHTSTITETKANRIHITRNETTNQKHFTVISAQPDGSAILETVLDRVKMSVRFNKQKPNTYDSATDKNPPQGFSAVAKTIGRALVRIKVEANGRLMATVPLLSRKIQARVVPYKGPSKPSNDPSKNFLTVFPTKPVRVGETWSDRKLKPRLRVSAGGRGLYQEFPMIRTYRLVSMKENLATIQIETVSLKPLSEVGLQIQASQLMPSVTIVFDTRRGLIVSRTTSTNSKVHGFSGAGSLLHVVSKRVETLVPRKIATAKKVATAKTSEKQN